MEWQVCGILTGSERGLSRSASRSGKGISERDSEAGLMLTLFSGPDAAATPLALWSWLCGARSQEHRDPGLVNSVQVVSV